MLKTQIEIEVRVTEIDLMGHVNNAKYLEYVEWSREDWYNKAGLELDSFQKLGIGTVVVNNNINYRKEAKMGEKLTVSTTPLRMGRTSFVFGHEIHNASGERIVDAVATVVTIDLNKRKAVPVPEVLAKSLKG